jgi:hypothetical protein
MQQSFASNRSSPLVARTPAEPWFVRLGVALLYLLVGIGWTWPLALHSLYLPAWPCCWHWNWQCAPGRFWNC